MDLTKAESITGPLHARVGTPFGRTNTVLVRADAAIAYPVVGEVPILLGPEALTNQPTTYDLRDSRWAEAYDEMAFYNTQAGHGEELLPRWLVDRVTEYLQAPTFPARQWLDSAYDPAAQFDAYRHLDRVAGQRFAQLGGKGLHAVKALLAGAHEALLISPMLNEVRFGQQLAHRFGVGDRFVGIVAIAEQLPLPDRSVGRIYSGGCLHHMAAEYAAPEIARVLTPGGRFAAVEPWQTPLHRLGTRVIGKREVGAVCRPMDDHRLAPLRDTFDELRLRHHGPLLRYAAIAAYKLSGRSISPRTGLRIARIDDALPLPRRMGGSLAVLGSRH
jgi:SAM-dependent methyltransferase